MNLSSKKIALICTFIFFIIIFSIYLFYNTISSFNTLLITLIFTTLSASFFAIINILISLLIKERISPLYKIITKKDNLRDRRLPENSTKLVEDWEKSRLSEIDTLKTLEKYRREFLGNVSHELKTPIFNIQGYVLTLLDGGVEDNSINYKYLEKTEKNINRLISIVEDLETISKLETGELKLEYSNFNLLLLINDIFEIHEINAQYSNIKLRIGKFFDKNILVNADKKRITDVFTNLISNSIKYGNRNGETIVNLYDFEEKVMIEIKDNGIGIAEKNLNKIFDRFYRVDKSRSREYGGTGLGLSIVKHIIDAHNQKINVSSELGKGTTFTFFLEKAK